ncbi:MAG TPA: hypothetical protein DCO79_14060 [Spirochaeta sp.]|nr:hypothetical protein [Spirochaeta sp.]
MFLKNKTLTADLMIILSALLWGVEYVVVKDLVEHLPPNWINTFRFIAASIIMLPLFWRRIRQTSRQEIKAGLILGVFMFGGFTLQTIGIQFTTAGKSGFLTSTYVVMVPFIVWIVKQKFPGFLSLLSAGILIVGVSLLSFEVGGNGFNKGDLLTLGAALCFSGSIIGFDYYSKLYEPINLTFVEMFFGGFLSLIVALIAEPFPVEFTYGPFEIFQLLFLVLLGSLACHLLSNIAMKWAEASHASILWSLESVFALIFGIIFLNEVLNIRMIFGFMFILAAVVLTERGDDIFRKLKSAVVKQ